LHEQIKRIENGKKTVTTYLVNTEMPHTPTCVQNSRL